MSGSVWQPRPLQNAQAGLKGNTSLKIPSSQNFWAEGTKLKLLFAKEVLIAKSPESAALLKSAMFINFLLLFLEYNRDNTGFLHSSFFVIDLQRSQRSPIWKDSWTLHVKKIWGFLVTRLQQMRILRPKLLTHHEKLSSYQTEKQINLHICLI